MEGEKIPSMPPEFSQDEGQRLTDQMAANAAVPASFGARNRYEPVWRSISPTDGGLQGDVEDQVEGLSGQSPRQTFYLDETGRRWSTVPWPERCLAYGPGVGGGLCGEMLELTVNTVNHNRYRIPVGGNNVSLLLRPKDVTLAIGEYKAWSMDCEDGSYKLRYDCARPGYYFLDVTVNGGHVCGSPFDVVVRPGKVEAQCCQIISGAVVPTSDGSSLVLPDTAIGVTHELWVETCDACGNRSYDSSGVFGARPVGAVRVTDVTDCETGIFVVAFTIVAGGPGRIDLLYNEEHIGSSPLWVEVEEISKVDQTNSFHGVSKTPVKSEPKDPLMVLEEKEARIRQMTVRLERLKRETDAKARESRRLMTERFQQVAELSDHLPESARQSLTNAAADQRSVVELAKMVSEVTKEREVYRQRNALLWEALHKVNDSWLRVEGHQGGADMEGDTLNRRDHRRRRGSADSVSGMPNRGVETREASGDRSAKMVWRIPRSRPNMSELFQRGVFLPSK